MMERTLILIKQDAVQRGLAGEIVKRFEQRGFKIVACRMVTPTDDILGKHYPDDKEWKISVGKKTRESMAQKGITMKESDEERGAIVRGWNVETLRGKPTMAIVFEGLHAVEIGRKIVGNTEPRQALPGTIRGDFSSESYAFADERQRVIFNLVHASGSVAEAEKEIKIWFKTDEVIDYKKKEWEVIHGV